jgi:amino acid adenylation domain-containing protein
MSNLPTREPGVDAEPLSGGPPGGDGLLHNIFESQVRKYPNDTAVICGSDRRTFEQVNQSANRLARRLRGLGVDSESLVGICLDRSPEQVISALAVLKSGGAFVPLDPNYPDARLSYMVHDADLAIVIADEAFVGRMPDSPRIVDVRQEAADPAELAPDLDAVGSSESLAYVIYTSGTTGMPKGVMVEHRNVVNLIAAQRQLFGFQRPTRVAQLSSFSFDAWVWELCLSLMSGSPLYLGSARGRATSGVLTDVVSTGRADVLTITPSALQALSASRGLEGRTLIVAGETCSLGLAERWAHGRRFVNAYGPTECTVCATAMEVRPTEDLSGVGSVPIGEPIYGAEVYLLDEHGSQVADGNPGEIYVGGRGVARGYWKQLELTRERFVPDPFSEVGSRMYRTGDMARRTVSGYLEFLGRADRQIKLRGHRIEPAEVESVLIRHPSIVAAAVHAEEDSQGHTHLAAYYVQGDTSITDRDVRAYLSETLPSFMVPARLHRVDTLPLTTSGKLDQLALTTAVRSPRPADATAVQNWDAPAIEQEIANLFATVLEIGHVAPGDDFFDLGGDSLMAMEVAATLSEQLDIALEPTAVFDFPTAFSLSQTCAELRRDRAWDGLT